MNTHSTTDLKPGDLVRHPERGCGIVARSFTQRICVYYASFGGDDLSATPDLTGWERVEIETIRPGHVQVRVNDLDLSRWEGVFEGGWNHSTRVAIRAANAISAQRDESTPPADEQDVSEDEASEYGVSATKFKCPWCDEEVPVILRHFRHQDGRVAASVYSHVSHTCPPVQPDEPTEFGARATVTLPDGTREKWCRLGKHHSAPWLGETYDVPGEEWGLLCQRGTVTLGWDDGEQP